MIKSGLDREMVFLISHSMHPYAMMGLSPRIKGKSVPKNLGVMPSMLKYQSEDEQILGSAAE